MLNRYIYGAESSKISDREAWVWVSKQKDGTARLVVGAVGARGAKRTQGVVLSAGAVQYLVDALSAEVED